MVLLIFSAKTYCREIKVNTKEGEGLEFVIQVISRLRNKCRASEGEGCEIIIELKVLGI